MKVLVLGAGNIGTAVIHDLLSIKPTADDIYVIDADKSRLSIVMKRYIKYNIKVIEANVLVNRDLDKVLGNVDVVCSALPGSISYQVVKKILSSGVSVVDTAYSPEDPFTLSDIAKENGVTYVPDCGFCPGISNLLVGYTSSALEKIINIQIIVGGLPQDPRPPLYYAATWSIDDLIDEYLRPARIIKEGRVEFVDPLSHIVKINLDGFGQFEAIYTDGLRTMLKTIKAYNMSELTIRHPGHLSKIKVLRDLGFFSNKRIKIKNQFISPRKIAIELLRELIKIEDPRDIAILRVIVDGLVKESVVRFQFDLIDKYDESTKLTAMSRTTGFPCAIVARLVAKGKIPIGVVPPELIGKDKKLFRKMIEELEKRNIRIRIIAPNIARL